MAKLGHLLPTREWTPHRPGRPPVWIGGSVAAARRRIGRLFGGWFPGAPPPAECAAQWAEVRAAAGAAGRNPAALIPAMYLTLALDDDAARADARANGHLERYYGLRPDAMRKRQMCLAGDARGTAAWLKSYADTGVEHMCLRLAGDPERQMETLARMRAELGG